MDWSVSEDYRETRRKYTIKHLRPPRAKSATRSLSRLQLLAVLDTDRATAKERFPERKRELAIPGAFQAAFRIVLEPQRPSVTPAGTWLSAVQPFRTRPLLRTDPCHPFHPLRTHLPYPALSLVNNHFPFAAMVTTSSTFVNP